VRLSSFGSVRFRRGVLRGGTISMAGCHNIQPPPAVYVSQSTMMPSNTVLLSTMMSDLSAEPGFDDRFISCLRLNCSLENVGARAVGR
jgi:hypothetical protein